MQYKELLALHSTLKNEYDVAEVHQEANGEIEPDTGKQIYKVYCSNGELIGPVSFDPTEWQHYNKTFKIVPIFPELTSDDEDLDTFLK